MSSDEVAAKSALELVTILPGTAEIESLDASSRAVALSAGPWVSGPNVNGLGVSEKLIDGQVTGAIALVVYVARKLPPGGIPHDHLVPPNILIPGIGNVQTDVQAIGQQRLEGFTEKVRPVVPGYSIGPAGGTGTLGCLVRKHGDSTSTYILSNSHVLAGGGTGKKGDVVFQPGPGDGGVTADTVAELVEWVDFDFSPGYNNLCDAAIAAVSNPALVTSDIPLIGKLKGINGSLSRGMTVQKSGRTTGHTVGTIRDVDYRTFMTYLKSDGNIGSAGFRNQVLCEKYSDHGDSGSIVCDMDGMAVGLHWCGSDSSSVFSPLPLVLQALGVDIIQ
ncbi:hypothetical protein ACWERI_37190 [Streptomyces collinus]